MTVAALLAFFLQSLAVQTHIHLPVQALAANAASPHAPAPAKSPDPIDQCRLCQELVHANAFVTPSAATIPVGLSFVTAVFAAQLVLAGAPTRAFAWQSRAPPRR